MALSATTPPPLTLHSAGSGDDSAAPPATGRPVVGGDWFKVIGLALLPVILAAGCYFRPFVLHGSSGLPVDADAGFYVYQFARMGELRGQWWKLADDELIGKPYPSSAAKHPGLYEGVDLLLISTVTSRYLDPVANYYVLILIVLAINGWVAAWITFQLTRSHGWAALAVVLITVNMSTALRMSIGHPHLLKYGWVLLAVWAFFRYLDAPTPWRGAWLGLAMALLLQGTVYLAFLLGLSLAAYWLGALLAGRLRRQHLLGAAAALGTLAVAGAVLTFPIWNTARTSSLAGQYTQRDSIGLWLYGSDLTQYLVPPQASFGWQLVRARPQGFEGWHYPGLLVLATVAAYLVVRARGWNVAEANATFLRRALVLMAIVVVLSLAGGPAVLVFQWVSHFSGYGRAGLLAVGLWSIAVPVILQGLFAQLTGALMRKVALAAVLLVALSDAYQGQRWFKCHATPPPAWVSWLAEQPADVRLIAFPAIRPYELVNVDTGHWHDLPCGMLQLEFDKWHWPCLAYRTVHGHATLNGGEFSLIEADLEKHGATYQKINEPGLRFLAAQGYDTLAFQKGYLEWHPWIEKLPWLERVQVFDDWQIFRVRPAR